MNEVKTGWPSLDAQFSHGPMKNYLVQSQASDGLMAADFGKLEAMVQATLGNTSFHAPDLTYSKAPTSLDPEEPEYSTCVPDDQPDAVDAAQAEYDDPDEDEEAEVAIVSAPISAIDELEVLTEKLPEIQYLPPTDAMIAKYMQRRCLELQIKQEKLGYYMQTEDPLQSIAKALDKAEFSSVDLMYACSLIRSFATLARNAKNDLKAMANDACTKEMAENTLTALSASMDRADHFAHNMHEEGGRWRKKVWLKTKEGRTTICQTPPKKVWDKLLQVWKYPDGAVVEQVWMVKRVESGTW